MAVSFIIIRSSISVVRPISCIRSCISFWSCCLFAYDVMRQPPQLCRLLIDNKPRDRHKTPALGSCRRRLVLLLLLLLLASCVASSFGFSASIHAGRDAMCSAPSDHRTVSAVSPAYFEATLTGFDRHGTWDGMVVEAGYDRMLVRSTLDSNIS